MMGSDPPSWHKRVTLAGMALMKNESAQISGESSKIKNKDT